MSELVEKENLLPSPSDPVNAAGKLVERIETANGVPIWQRWRGDWYRWRDSHWALMPLEMLYQWLMRQTMDAIHLDEKGQDEPWEPTSHKLGELEKALGTLWLNRPEDTEPDKVVACRNGVVDLASSDLEPHDPRTFNLQALPFEFDPFAECPAWLQFLSDVLPQDQVPLLQQWFGYAVCGDTSRQKILSLVGQPRSGKGTVARVLTELLGRDQVCAPTIGSLTGPFGLQPLLGRSLAIIGDARWTGVRDIGQAVERLKGISGEDTISVDRKNRTAWNGRLPTRFMIMSNDQPTFTDASAALAGRMLSIETRQSFVGREDLDLTDRLLAELPGILNWALDGLGGLNASGRFVVPASSAELSAELARTSSPVRAWVDAEVDLAPGHTELMGDLYRAFKTWTEAEGFQHVTTKQGFAKQLRAALGPAASVLPRARVDGGRRDVQVVGLRITVPNRKFVGTQR